MTPAPAKPLAEVAAAAGATLPAGADPDRPVSGAAAISDAGPDEVVALGDAKYVRQLAASRAGVVLRGRRVKLADAAAAGRIVLDVDDAELALADVLALFAPPPVVLAGVHPSAVVADTATLGADVALGPNAVVGDRATLGDGCRIHANASVGADVTLGPGCELLPGAVVMDRCTLGARVRVHPNAVIGADGFGYRWDGEKHRKIPQIGTVELGDDVEIGAGSCVDRAKMSVTRIGAGTKIDNLVQIGHNVETGRHCVICGQTGIAGSTKLGDLVVLGGQNALNGHITVGSRVMAAARSAIAESIPDGRVIGGQPAMPQRQYLREQVAARRLPELVVQVRKLQEQVDRLAAAAADG